jgi:hypothetical protein
MFVDTYRYGRVSLPVAPIYGNKVLRVLADTVISVSGAHGNVCIGEGWLLVRRGTKDHYDGKYAIYNSIEAALRGYRKAVDLYGDDRRGELAEIEAMRDDANQFVFEITDPSRINRAAREAIESTIAGSASVLAGDSNKHKAAARADLKAAASSVDRLGRQNFGRRRMLLGQARISLTKRVKEIQGILRNLAPWIAAIGAYYRDRILVLWEVKGVLEHLLSLEDRRWWISSTVHRLCKQMADRITILDVEPFLTCRDCVIGYISRARAATRQRDFDAVRRSLNRALMAVRIGLAHVYLEGIRVELELLAMEDGEPGADKLVSRELVMSQRDKLIKFLKQLEELDDVDMGVRTLGKVRELVTGVVASLENGQMDEFSVPLQRAVALL